jgi:hypothetical protein
MIVTIFIMLIGLAAANGANDVSTGVATLAGVGVTRYRTALLWGTVTTLAGALLSIQLGRGMGKPPGHLQRPTPVRPARPDHRSGPPRPPQRPAT